MANRVRTVFLENCQECELKDGCWKSVCFAMLLMRLEKPEGFTLVHAKICKMMEHYRELKLTHTHTTRCSVQLPSQPLGALCQLPRTGARRHSHFVVLPARAGPGALLSQGCDCLQSAPLPPLVPGKSLRNQAVTSFRAGRRGRFSPTPLELFSISKIRCLLPC